MTTFLLALALFVCLGAAVGLFAFGFVQFFEGHRVQGAAAGASGLVLLCMVMSFAMSGREAEARECLAAGDQWIQVSRNAFTCVDRARP
jgi:hypothetical protein